MMATTLYKASDMLCEISDAGVQGVE